VTTSATAVHSKNTFGAKLFVYDIRPRLHHPNQPGDPMNMKLELVPVPVTDVDRAKAFYTDKGRLGRRCRRAARRGGGALSN